jgi:hypothetical protein
MMKKVNLILIGLLMCYANPAYAFMPIDVEYTGNEVARANDTPLQFNTWVDLGLGGPVGNQFIVEKAFQFTIEELAYVSYLSIDATIIPKDLYDYPDPRVNDPQSMDVYFKLFDATKPFGSDQHPGPDFSSLVVSSSYVFTTDDSKNSKDYNHLKIPFESELKPGNSYWIYATDPQFSGATLNYSTRFLGRVITPEPATMLLFGMGLLGTFLRKRRR